MLIYFEAIWKVRIFVVLKEIYTKKGKPYSDFP